MRGANVRCWHRADLSTLSINVQWRMKWLSRVVESTLSNPKWKQAKLSRRWWSGLLPFLVKH
jgi:hypothetical protein